MNFNKNSCIANIVSFFISITSFIVFIIALGTGNILMLGVSLLLIFLSLVILIFNTLFKRTRYTTFELIELFCNFIITIVFVIAFLSSIQNDDIKSVAVPISSSVIGGLLTLTGVGLTIKYARIEKEEDEIKKAKPIIFPISDDAWNNLDNEKRTEIIADIDKEESDIKEDLKSSEAYIIRYITLANSDSSLCSLSGIEINNKKIFFKYGQMLAKNSNNIIFLDSGEGFRFVCKDKIENVNLLVSDILDNVYRARINFEIDNYNIRFNSIYDIKLVEKSNKKTWFF